MLRCRKNQEFKAALKEQMDEVQRKKDEEKARRDEEKRREYDHYIKTQWK
jgi:hypothetical protein